MEHMHESVDQPARPPVDGGVTPADQAPVPTAEDRYRALFTTIDEGYGLLELIYAADGSAVDWRIVEVNPAFERLTSLRDTVGKTARELNPATEPSWVALLHNVARTGEARRFEHRAAGLDRWFEVYAARVGGDGSRTVAVVFNNVTARKRAEAALRASEETFRAIVNQTSVGIAHAALSGALTFANQKLCEMLRYDAAALVGKTIWELTYADDLEENRRLFEQLRTDGTAFEVEKRLVRKDQSILWANVSATAIRDQDGHPHAIVAVVLDITAHKQAEEHLRASEARLQRALEIGTVGVIFFTADGSITNANDAFLRMSGYTPEDVANGLVRWDTMTPKAWMPHSLRAIEELRTLGRTTPYEKEYIRKDGSRWWALFAASRITEDVGVEFIIDITPQKQAEAERTCLLHQAEQARAAAEAALRVRDQFLSIASHELRTPLTSLLGYASLLPQAVARGTGQVDTMTDRIVRQAQRLNTLIDQLLDVSRLARGQFVIEHQPVDLAALAAQVMDEVRATLPPNTCHTVHLLPPDAPVVVDGDPERLEQVLHNLLSNAVKYSPAGGPIHVRVGHTTMEAMLEVTDEGIGIPQDAQAHLFEAFYRANHVGMHFSGFGLGLHIVREIVERHGGCIAVTSTEGAGSTFRVVLPLRAAVAPAT